ncbi:MAG: hypothetical protein HZRFUVUK_000535 [Candidatus Fervidibacterota bacterium]|jgi:pyridoxal phosphate enzyme (YggS family)
MKAFLLGGDKGMEKTVLPLSPQQVAERFASVLERINSAATRVGRDPSSIIVIGATKSVDVERIKVAISAGLKHIGENYVQEAMRKYEAIGDVVKWHFIGHLQTNKAKYVVRFFETVQSLDRISLAEELSKRALMFGRRIDVLVQVNIGAEETKFGIPPEDTVEFVKAVSKLEGIRVRGLMCIPPYKEDPEDVRPYFRRMLWLAEAVARAKIPNVSMDYLSMGMSHDFEVAIEEGANMVRIGTAIFGPRE